MADRDQQPNLLSISLSDRAKMGLGAFSGVFMQKIPHCKDHLQPLSVAVAKALLDRLRDDNPSEQAYFQSWFNGPSDALSTPSSALRDRIAEVSLSFIYC
jgi:hypothetical protein